MFRQEQEGQPEISSGFPEWLAILNVCLFFFLILTWSFTFTISGLQWTETETPGNETEDKEGGATPGLLIGFVVFSHTGFLSEAAKRCDGERNWSPG